MRQKDQREEKVEEERVNKGSGKEKEMKRLRRNRKGEEREEGKVAEKRKR